MPNPRRNRQKPKKNNSATDFHFSQSTSSFSSVTNRDRSVSVPPRNGDVAAVTASSAISHSGLVS
ncbi:unnamed protein product, partial [Arabis nemorensis]